MHLRLCISLNGLTFTSNLMQSSKCLSIKLCTHWNGAEENEGRVKKANYDLRVVALDISDNEWLTDFDSLPHKTSVTHQFRRSSAMHVFDQNLSSSIRRCGSTKVEMYVYFKTTCCSFGGGMNASLCLNMWLSDSIVHGARIGSLNWSTQLKSASQWQETKDAPVLPK